VVDVFADEEMGEQAGCGQAADKRGGGRWRDDGREVAVFLAAELGADNAAFEKPGGGDVEQLGDFLADAIKGSGIGGDEVGMISVVSTGRFSRPVIRERWEPRFFAGRLVSAAFDTASTSASALVEVSGFPGMSANSSSSWAGSIFSPFDPKRRRMRWSSLALRASISARCASFSNSRRAHFCSSVSMRNL
jgi:hypothetical protein